MFSDYSLSDLGSILAMQGFAGLILCSILANEGLPDIPSGFMGRAADTPSAAARPIKSRRLIRPADITVFRCSHSLMMRPHF